MSEAVLNGGTCVERWEFKSDGNWAEGERLTKQAGPGGGPNVRVGFHPGLKRDVFPGPSSTISKNPDRKKLGSGLKNGLQLVQAEAHKSSSGLAARRKGLIGPNVRDCFHPGLKRDVFPGPSSTISKNPDRKKLGSGLKNGLQLVQAEAHKNSSGLAARRKGLIGPNVRDCFHPGLKRDVFPGPSSTISKNLDRKKLGSGLKNGLQLVQAEAHKSSSGLAARRKGLIGPKWPGSMQAGPSNGLNDLKPGKRDFWGLNKGYTKPRSGPVGGSTGSSVEGRMKEGGSSPGAEGASNPLVDPAWICARGTLLHAKEGWSGRGRTSRFESCWEKGLSLVPMESPATGGSGQGNGGEELSDGSSLTLTEVVPMCPEVVDPKMLRIHAKGSRFDTLSLVDCSSPPFSVFGRPLLSGDSSGSGDLYEHEFLGDLEPLRVVSRDGREWGKGIANALMEDVQEIAGPGSSKGEAATVGAESTGYNNWEDSCLFKFSEYLGVTTVGFEEEILSLMRKMEVKQEEDKRKGNSTESKCVRELRKLECAINYSGKSQNRGGRDRGNFLLKLK